MAKRIRNLAFVSVVRVKNKVPKLSCHTMDLLFLHAISIQWPNIYAKPIHNDDEAFLKFIYSEKATKSCEIFPLL